MWFQHAKKQCNSFSPVVTEVTVVSRVVLVFTSLILVRFLVGGFIVERDSSAQKIKGFNMSLKSSPLS